MSKIDDLCNEMAKEHRRATTLLSGAHIGHCPRPSCTPEEPCRGCVQCGKMTKKIEAYVND